jgi:hypothetical protein
MESLSTDGAASGMDFVTGRGILREDKRRFRIAMNEIMPTRV